MKIFHASISDIGRTRKINEDSVYVSKRDGIYLIADGMGGHLAGEVASKIAVETVASFLKSTRGDKEITWPFQRDEALTYDANRFIVSIKLANKKIFNQGRERNLPGMGTTIVGLLCNNQNVNMCHVGDSRIYRIRDGRIERMTEDHSLLNDTIKREQMTAEEIEKFPYKNVITRALGIEESVTVDLRLENARDNDYYILCSDGLSNFMSEDEITEIIIKNKANLQKSCKELVKKTNGKGGLDNISAVIIRFTEGPKPKR